MLVQPKFTKLMFSTDQMWLNIFATVEMIVDKICPHKYKTMLDQCLAKVPSLERVVCKRMDKMSLST